MEYLSIFVSVTSIFVAILAAYISNRNKANLQRQLEEYNRKKQEMKSRFEQKSKEMHL